MDRKTIIERAVEELGAPISERLAHESAPATNLNKKRRAQVTTGSISPEIRSKIVRTNTVKLDLDKLRSDVGISQDGHFTRTTEEIRLIKRAVLLTRDKRRKEGSKTSNLILVTSAREGEGKTFIAINLAMSIAAERNTRALLVDGDLSKPSVLDAFGVRVERGLTDVLTDDSLGLSDVLLNTNIEGLTLLPAGRPHPLNTELLSSTRMRNVVSELSQRYDDRVVILDAPPVLATSESAALAIHVGQIIFVVEAGQTTEGAIREAINLISICPDISFVMNKVSFQFGETRFGSYYKNYRSNYYAGTKRKSHISAAR